MTDASEDSPPRRPGRHRPPSARRHAEAGIATGSEAENAGHEDAGLDRRDVWVFVAVSILLPLVTTWPLVLHLGSYVPGDLIDPLAEAWELSWGGRLFRDPLDLWQGNTFHPAPDSYAFSDSLLGLSPLTFLGSGATGALLRYNLAFIGSYSLCLLAAALLGRELGLRRFPALAAGIAFAYAPWRAAHHGHLNILLVGGYALAAFLLLRGYRRGSPRLIISGWLAAAWQLSLGFAMGIYFAYGLLAAGVAVGIWWLLRGRPSVSRRVVIASAVGIVLLGISTLLLVRPYLRVVDRYPTALRSRADLDFYSPPPKGLLAAGPTNRLWGERTKDVREDLPWAPEQALFPGLGIVILAGIGVGGRVLSKSARVAIVVGGTAATLLSFGTRFAGGRFTYLPLFDHAPGWQSLRTPGRLTVYTTLALALLAGAGVHWLSDLGRRRSAHIISAGWILVILAEGLATLPQYKAPRVPDGWSTITQPAVHLPALWHKDPTFMFWSTDGFPRISNGNTSFLPPMLADLRVKMENFPSADSVEAARALGFRHVVVHPTMIPGTAFANALLRPTDGLPLTMERRGDLVVFTLT